MLPHPRPTVSLYFRLVCQGESGVEGVKERSRVEQLGSSERSSSKLWRRVRDSTRSWLVAPTTRVGQPVCRCVGERACARSVTRLERPAGRCSGSHRGHLDLRADRSGGHHRRTGLRPLRAAQKPASAAQLEPAHQPHHVHGGGSSVAGAAFITINEWNNPATLGELHPAVACSLEAFKLSRPVRQDSTAFTSAKRSRAPGSAP